MERNGVLVFEIQKVQLVLGLSLALSTQWDSLNRRQLDVQGSVFPPPSSFRGQVIILRTFMMHLKDTVQANIGMRYLIINAFLGRCWHHFVHSSSEFGSYCLGDLAYIRKPELPPLPSSQIPSWQSSTRVLSQTLAIVKISLPLSSHTLMCSIPSPERGKACLWVVLAFLGLTVLATCLSLR